MAGAGIAGASPVVASEAGVSAARAGALGATDTPAGPARFVVAAAADVCVGDEVHHHVNAVPRTMPAATARSPVDGTQALPRSRGCLAMAFARQGAGALGTDSAHPMRSCPYWFQIGLLPLVNEVKRAAPVPVVLPNRPDRTVPPV